MEGFNEELMFKIIAKSRSNYEKFKKQVDYDPKCSWDVYYEKYALYNREIRRGKEAHDIIRTYISAGKPFSAVRVGNTEANIIIEYIEKQFNHREQYSSEWKQWLLTTSGFFAENSDSVEDEIDKFALVQLEAISCANIYFAANFMYLDCLENLFSSARYSLLWVSVGHTYKKDFDPWTRALAGRKVLLVSPFADSIKEQYLIKEKLSRWERSILPDFDLVTYKMILTMCGDKKEFNSWFEALKKIKEDILSIDFDVAIVGAGAYGLPLCMEIQKAGKQAIELCSFTPLLFGIIGKRHIDQGWFDDFGTPYWIRPKDEKPLYYLKIEDGAYW